MRTVFLYHIRPLFNLRTQSWDIVIIRAAELKEFRKTEGKWAAIELNIYWIYILVDL